MIVTLANSAECIGNFLTNCGVTEVSCAAAYNYVAVWYREFFPVGPEKFPDHPLQSISGNRITNLLAGGYAQPWTSTGRFAKNDDKIWCWPFSGICCQPEKIGPFAKPGRLVKSEHSEVIWLFGCNRNRKPFSALGPAALDYEAAVFCCHPHQKTVSALTRDVAWLKSTFHILLLKNG